MTKTIELRVYGMTCNDCMEHVSSGLKNANGVNNASVSLKDGMALVKATDPEDFIKLDVFKGQYRAQVRSVKND
ncbi:heavy-metal-associated domain-containing protein [Ferroplasma acidiphilum]|uniref:heavy-metal-associated domain-containing protein n=1 Tax=Ferroplasma acidiphilum TaxID=74969 RepID=UPI002814CD00|nr:cation transporter [Ferroplasma acidiphilum]WMT53723.1 MAG: cation transporter [Ferroplasma acidiphilum]